MKMLQSIKNNIPNSITCLNLLCGALFGIAVGFVAIAIVNFFEKKTEKSETK